MSDKRSLPFKDPFFNFISYPRAVCWMFSYRPLREEIICGEVPTLAY